MQGTLIQLRVPRLSEFEQICDWISSGSDSSGFINTHMERHDPEELRKAYLNKDVNILVIDDKKEVPVGLVIFRSVGFYRNYEVTIAVADKKNWNMGYGAEAMARATELLFMTYDAHRVQFMTASYNDHMLDMLITNFPDLLTIDGILRETLFLDGSYHDMIVWSILRREYLNLESSSASHGDDPFPVLFQVSDQEKEKARKRLRDYLSLDPRTSIKLATDADDRRDGIWTDDA